jgi:hypothetical protein
VDRATALLQLLRAMIYDTILTGGSYLPHRWYLFVGTCMAATTIISIFRRNQPFMRL